MRRFFVVVALSFLLMLLLVGCAELVAGGCVVEDVAYAADVDGDDYFFALDLFGFECD